MVKIQIVKRKLLDLKPDPDQPRKQFNNEAIENLANTMKTQGIINPIEIDENNVIITGEIRWRAYKSIHKDGKLIACKLLIGIGPIERFERQMVENIHHNLLDDNDIENGVKKLWDQGNPKNGNGRYKNQTDLAKILGYSNSSRIAQLLSAYNFKEKHEILNVKIPSKTAYDLSTLPESYQKPVLKKIIQEEIRPSDVQEVVSEIKKLPIDVKTELMKPKVKITREKLEEAKEVAKLTPEVRKEVLKPKPKITLEEAKEVDKMPEDIKREVLKPKSKVTVKEAKIVADIPKPEIRKEALKHLEREKQQHEQTVKYIEDVAKGNIEPPKKYIDIDQRIVNQFIDIRKQVVMKMSKRHVETYNEQTRTKLYKIMKDILEFLQKELNMKGEVLNV